MAFDASKLSYEERRQYASFEDLFAYSYGVAKDEKALCMGILLTIEDWKKRWGVETVSKPKLNHILKQ